MKYFCSPSAFKFMFKTGLENRKLLSHVFLSDVDYRSLFFLHSFHMEIVQFFVACFDALLETKVQF